MKKVKYFCDLCEEEVEDLSNMFSFILNQDDIESQKRSYGKSTILECDICLNCFDEIRDTIYKLEGGD